MHYVYYSHEDVCNRRKYVMYEGRYNYRQAVAKCDAEGGIIAMAADQDTFNCLFGMFKTYRSRGGKINLVHLDGSLGVMNQQFSGWFCVNTGGACPATMPWQPGQPDQPDSQRCVVLWPPFHEGVDNAFCGLKKMVICQF